LAQAYLFADKRGRARVVEGIGALESGLVRLRRILLR